MSQTLNLRIAPARAGVTDLESLDTHFRFGENWASFARLLTPERIDRATRSLSELLPEGLGGKSFLDIGSGSGLSSVAAARLGAGPIFASDIDPDSVATTRKVLGAYHSIGDNTVRRLSVFDMKVGEIGQFDVVHSWGVLHHTGAMWKAIGKATEFVKPGGLFVVALYLKTPFCGAWRMEKRFYTASPKPVQNLLFHAYRAVAALYALARLKNPARLSAQYHSARGMELDHDIRDWLGGYPYESASPEELDAFLKPRGFEKVRSLRTRRRSGLMGTGCAEYVYRKSD